MQRSLDLLALAAIFFEDLNSKARKGGGARPFIPELLV